ncbi:MAG TPA: hypothetical protein VFC67_17080 [Prolixibacteraceae bacterium]|nr:hypothetical protein [Prolixibacteraceae bacterium]
MRLLLYIFVNVLIVGLFLYSKLTPHKDRLTGNFLKTFNFFDKIFHPILGIFRPMARPAQVGNGIAVDMSQIILLVILLVLIKFL